MPAPADSAQPAEIEEQVFDALREAGVQLEYEERLLAAALNDLPCARGTLKIQLLEAAYTFSRARMVNEFSAEFKEAVKFVEAEQAKAEGRSASEVMFTASSMVTLSGGSSAWHLQEGVRQVDEFGTVIKGIR